MKITNLAAACVFMLSAASAQDDAFGLGNDLHKAINDLVDKAATEAVDTVEKASDAAKEAVDKTKEVADAATEAADKAKEVADTVADKAKEVADTVADKAKEVADTAVDKAKEVADTAADKAKEVADAADAKAKEVEDAAAAKAKEAADAAAAKEAAIKKAVEEKEAKAKEEAEKVAKETKELHKKTKEYAKKLWNDAFPDLTQDELNEIKKANEDITIEMGKKFNNAKVACKKKLMKGTESQKAKYKNMMLTERKVLGLMQLRPAFKEAWQSICKFDNPQTQALCMKTTGALLVGKVNYLTAEGKAVMEEGCKALAEEPGCETVCPLYWALWPEPDEKYCKLVRPQFKAGCYKRFSDGLAEIKAQCKKELEGKKGIKGDCKEKVKKIAKIFFQTCEKRATCTADCKEVELMCSKGGRRMTNALKKVGYYYKNGKLMSIRDAKKRQDAYWEQKAAIKEKEDYLFSLQ